MMQRILLIDDNGALREEIANLLEVEGFVVETAPNGRVGLERIKEQRPDLVICDLVMPDMDGYETLQAVRSNPDTETLPFLLLTAREEREQMRYGMELGADDYITKPFKVGDLLRAVKAVFEKRARLERRAQMKLDHLREQVAMALPHELRTPLACIMGYAEMLGDVERAASAGDVHALARQIIGAGERLNRMSENALLYVQLELLGGGLGTVKQGIVSRTRLDEVVARQAELKAAAHGRSQDLVVELREVSVPVGSAYVAKVVDELVDNACKFSPTATPVRVSTAVEGPWAVLRVADGGSGMADEAIASVGGFVQFERSVREQQGLGLGLSIASRIAKVWGGTLSIESILHAGTTVTARFPLAVAPTSTARSESGEV
jgi:signal transduction histidine kinase